MTYSKIFLDNDISATTDFASFKQVHTYFKEAIVMHTIAVICKDIENNIELVDYIKKNNIDVQVQCWTPYDLTADHIQANIDLNMCVNKIEDIFGERPTVLYPPENKTDHRLHEIAKALGLTISTESVSLDEYCKKNGEVEEEVISFCYSDEKDIMLLETALKIYNDKRG